MFKQKVLFQAMLLALVLPVSAIAEVEVGGYLKNETAVFTKDGQVTGEATSMLDEEGHDKWDLMKFENSARIFLNGDIGDESSWHGDLNFIYDSEGVNSNYKGHELYTQNDWLRELYVDTTGFGWDFRLGKQQVVWGTADGIKLLDIINPTDFRELNQNTTEDARIPIWMINAERNVGNSGNVQLIVSQVEENKIPGLNEDGDAGHPFIMKGVDAITGQVDGFRDVTPALSNVAATFTAAAASGAFTGGMPVPGLNIFAGLTVDGFASGSWDITSFPLLNQGTGLPDPTDPTNFPGYLLLNAFAQFGFSGQPPFPADFIDPNGNFGVTNLMAITGMDPTNPFNPADVSWLPSQGQATSAFEFMSNATFATFNTFSTFDPTAPTFFTGTTTEYVRDYPDDSDVNAGFRWKQNLDSGLNYSLNYFYHYSSNPDIDLSWHNDAGDELTVQRAPTLMVPNTFGVPDVSTSLTRDEARANWDLGNPTTILVHDGAGTYYGAFDITDPAGGFGPGAPTLRFTESLHRVNSLGASFDYGLSLGDLPVVLRGEFLYDQDDRQPVIDKYLLSIGDITNSLKMEEADYFKYVLGLDVTVLTNMLVSGQFIQFRNLDYVDEPDTCVSQGGLTVDCGRYTADFATLSLTNDLNKGYENKEFYSLFFSKPFGPSQEHRWNNITIYEDGGGWWNRADVEYTFTDTILASAEWNHYWGDEDTTFGQFDKSSNLQVGVKWIFE